MIEPETKDRLLQSIARAMDGNGRFITYQITTQLCDHEHLFKLSKKALSPEFPSDQRA